MNENENKNENTRIEAIQCFFYTLGCFTFINQI